MMVPQHSSSFSSSTGNGNSIRSEDIDDVTALNAACSEISQLIRSNGRVGAAQCAEIMIRKTENTRVLWSNFPGAISSTELLEKVSNALETRGYSPEKTHLAISMCPDEINREKGDIADLFTGYFGDAFQLGGLAGIPFTGKTGFKIFSDHISDDGHCFVLMAPHVGLDDNSHVGKYSREGQPGSAKTACSAAVGAFTQCCSNQPFPGTSDIAEDYQMAYLTHQFALRKETILAAGVLDANFTQSELAKQTHELSREMLDKIINVDFGGQGSSLVILTGIQINMPRPFEDYFQPISFYAMDKGGNRHDLFDASFGHAALSVHSKRKKKPGKRNGKTDESPMSP